MAEDIRYYARKIPEVLSALKTREEGLTLEEVKSRVEHYGENKLPERKQEAALAIFVRQFKSPLIYLLFFAGLIVFAMGEVVDALVILFVLAFNAVIGTIQEGKAQNALASLQKYVATNATVIRGGSEMIISDREVVPGDIVLLRDGEKVSADARLIFSRALKIDEAALTGESTPVHKEFGELRNINLQTPEQTNMVFKGTYIFAGEGKAVVVTTGINTVIGKISEKIATINTEIPLQKDIRNLSRVLMVGIIGLSVGIFVLGIYLGNPLREMFATVVSLAVSMIPEGLPVVMTLVLATGVWRMSKKHALVRRLQAVEALGQARVIAVDKTGTITRNELIVRKVVVGDTTFDVSGTGYDSHGEIVCGEITVDPLNHEELVLAGKIATCGTNVRVVFSEDTKQWRVAGDPTEAAMLVFGQKIGFKKHEIEEEFPVIDEVPFDYATKYRAVARRSEAPDAHTQFITVIGAPESVMPLMCKQWTKEGIVPFSKDRRTHTEAVFHKLSGRGLRVVAFGYADGASAHSCTVHALEKCSDLTFVGFYALEDSLRPEVVGAMQRSREANIRVVMITGDHPLTAMAIAKEAGIFRDGDATLTGKEIDELSAEELAGKLSATTIFARVTPEHKMRIIEGYKKRGEIVAMTGDGVNDALSLVAADLGVAMGNIGTEVAKEAADIVLLDDDFGSIVSAVEEGRNIYMTIKRVLLFLLSTGLGEMLAIVGALLLGYPLPFTPAQIIWLNLVTDTFLTIALAMEPKEEGLLTKRFKRPGKYLIDKHMVARLIGMGLVIGIGTLVLFESYLGGDIVKAWTIALTASAMFQWYNAFNCRSQDESVFRYIPANPYFAWSIFIVVVLQVLAVYTPFMQDILRTTALTLADWGIILAIGFSVVVVEEIRKAIHRAMKLAAKNRHHEPDLRPSSP